MSKIFYNECFKDSTEFISVLFVTPVINEYITIPITKKMNSKMFNDLFIGSHRKLAIKSIQTIYGVNNFFIIGEILYSFNDNMNYIRDYDVICRIGVEMFLNFKIKDREFLFYADDLLYAAITSDSEASSIQYHKIYIATPEIRYKRVII